MKAFVTACTNRKRHAPDRHLLARSLKRGSLATVTVDWVSRLEAAREVSKAGEFYCGRSFLEATTAAEALGGELFVVSAGLGLVKARTMVPAYSLTVSRGHPDSVLARLPTSVLSTQWWIETVKNSPYSCRRISTDIELLVVALPGPYLEMFLPALERWVGAKSRQLRVICRPEQQGIPNSLRSAIIEYDDRLEGDGSPLPGTMADFAARAGHHFVELILRESPRGSATKHREIVDRALANYRVKERVIRPRMADAEIKRVIAKHWNEVDGRSGRMLRLLRDELDIACEQKRFRDLFRSVATNQTEN